MRLAHLGLLLAAALVAWGAAPLAWAQEQAPAAAQSETAVATTSAKFVEAFNKGDVDALSGMFLNDGELIDETGAVYQGRQEIRGLLAAFFEKFPGVQLSTQVDSIRIIGPVAFIEGTRTITTKQDGVQSDLRYVITRVNTADGWKIASLREFEEPQPATPNEMLQPLAWLIGNWVNEGDDARIEISYRWSDDENYLLGTYKVTREGKTLMDSQQRIGWDPVTGQIRSWLFDSDGGFAEARWTQMEDGWVIKSNATLPDGLTGSATVTLAPESEAKFVMKGRDRISGDERLDDFDVVVTKLPDVKK